MKIKTITIGILLWLTALTIGVAQETNSTLDLLVKAKEQVIQEEKDALKKEVEAINKRLENKEVTAETAETLKQAAAEKRALNIENRVAIIDNKIALLERNGTLDEEAETIGFKITIGDEDDESYRVINIGPEREREVVYDRRTYSGLVFSFGLNNAIIDGQSLDDSPYTIGRSRYTELGISWSTRVFKETNWLRVKYGFSFQFNGLAAKDNLFQVDTGQETELLPFGDNLDKSKFRMDNLVVPVFFEIGPSRKIVKDDYFRYNTAKDFKIGFGGYAGLNLAARQKLKYEVDGDRIKEKIKGDFNTNNFVYGVAGYIGYDDISLYAKYDLNPIFGGEAPEQRNVSLGLRWDWD